MFSRRSWSRLPDLVSLLRSVRTRHTRPCRIVTPDGGALDGFTRTLVSPLPGGPATGTGAWEEEGGEATSTDADVPLPATTTATCSALASFCSRVSSQLSSGSPDAGVSTG